MWMYIVTMVVIIGLSIASVWGFSFAFQEQLSELITGLANQNLTTQVLLAVSIPFGTLLPVLFSFIKAIDILFERITEIRKAKSVFKLANKIREATSEGMEYPISESEWENIYQLQRDGLVAVKSRKKGFTASYI